MEGYFPVLLRLEDKPCLVVGGGSVAERRIASLLEARAKVKVVSPEMTETIGLWAREGRIEALQRPYLPEDQAGMYLVIAATDNASVNDRVLELARRHNRAVNMAERPELGDFIVPSVVRRGKLVIAVSTLGASPTVAASVRRQIEACFGEEYETYLDFLSEFRLRTQEQVQDTRLRQELYRSVLQENVLEKIKNGEFEEWKSRIMSQMGNPHPSVPASTSGGKACAKL
ncbi:bifunctional precorrin-2 dehydrogenase/sirohydrochlorin ferrochelatase [Paenibacillus sp. YN15]|uniref:precorrin-2 dehydrogenase/sirohydrochlorin ferrochelatase family protein n=1 Tax=Paenibacillus sp. YN15 TaxID=1742774 RepID=UPI000DCD446E|nr:bifunctional precorrin-2 dehydrogenase/sirohydrochlorin ferrochelatase [Paenibacillus sp. YN15]RAV06350.1 bifunctional precorrin-2 dehydrogenase/sirohydrochlorin ferrochelatase [Paenibacillus sp. YN15]